MMDHRRSRTRFASAVLIASLGAQSVGTGLAGEHQTIPVADGIVTTDHPAESHLPIPNPKLQPPHAERRALTSEPRTANSEPQTLSAAGLLAQAANPEDPSPSPGPRDSE